MDVAESNQPASDNDWEAVKKRGAEAVQKWIDGQLQRFTNASPPGANWPSRWWTSSATTP